MTRPNSRVLKMAHYNYSHSPFTLGEIIDPDGKTIGPDISLWKACLRRAWRVNRLVEQLKAGVINFYYTKEDGTLREAIGTLKIDLIPEDQRPKGIINRHEVVGSVAYYDLNRRGWRSFNICKVHLTSVYKCVPVWTADATCEIDLTEKTKEKNQKKKEKAAQSE